MFGISMSELLIIGAVALLILGPKKFPALAKGIGKVISELQKAASDLWFHLRFEDTFDSSEEKESPYTSPEEKESQKETKKKDAGKET
jgi:TatA/E family protein of Tat protein translocase